MRVVYTKKFIRKKEGISFYIIKKESHTKQFRNVHWKNFYIKRIYSGT